MNEITTINPDDARLTRQLVYESKAATAAYESTRIRNLCIGMGVVVLAAGIGLAALVWAWGQGVDPEALKQAIANMPPIKVETTVKDGEVTLKDGGVVAIKDGAKVGVDGTVKVDGGTVELAQGAVVEVAGTISATAPAPVGLPDVPAPASTPDGDKIKREVVVYNQVPHANGQVHTGWTFPNGGAKTPINEFCYFVIDHNDGSSERIDLGENGNFDSRATNLLKSAREAFGKCVWFKGVI